MDPIPMEVCFHGSEDDRENVEETTSHLRDRFRLSTISIAESEAKQDNMGISQSVIVCISDLAFKYAEQLAEDLEMFAHHAGRKSVNMKDVIISGTSMKTKHLNPSINLHFYGTPHSDDSFFLISAHRNKHLTDLLRTFSDTLKSKEPQSEKKRKKSSNKEGKSLPVVLDVDP
ncbi:hypothetical protein LXL04_030844 [Taraxacum kok-saghyz]